MKIMSEGEVNSLLFDEVASARAENERLRNALHLAREWGIRGRGYDAAVAMALSKWIDSGMTADLPPVPDYLNSEAK